MADRARDTQPIRTATGQPYGAAGQQAAAQRVIPLPDRRGSGETPAAGPPGQGAPAGPAARQVPDVYGPTDFPDEPVTAGAALGPGSPSMEPLLPEDRLAKIRAAYMMFPDPALARLLELAESKRIRG